MEFMGKTSRRKQERFIPVEMVEIKIIHTDQRVHLREGQHIITVMFDFKSQQARPGAMGEDDPAGSH